MTTKQSIKELIESSVNSLGYELWAIEYIRGKDNILRVYIDKEGMVTIDDCVKVSNQISAVLDVENPINNRYNLEVSSPGAERILCTIGHYNKFIGNTVMIKLAEAINNKFMITGKIKAVNGDNIIIIADNNKLEIAFNCIKKAKLVVSL